MERTGLYLISQIYIKNIIKHSLNKDNYNITPKRSTLLQISKVRLQYSYLYVLKIP